MMVERLRGRAAVKARAAYLAMHPLCKHCRDKGRISAALEVDHVIPLHDGGSDDDGNKQGLCKPCHRLKTTRDMGYAPKGADEQGMPTDPNHPWNKGCADGR